MVKIKTKQHDLEKKIKNFLCFGFLVFNFFIFNEVFAAEIYFEPYQEEIRNNQIFEIKVKIDAQNQSLNAIEGEIVFSENIELINIKKENSLINLWIQEPIFENNAIIFSGIIPGGYQGEINPYLKGYQPGEIIELIFKAKQAGLAKLTIKQANVLLNDGKGSSADLKIKNLEFKITEQEQGLSYKKIIFFVLLILIFIGLIVIIIKIHLVKSSKTGGGA